jgi:quinol monooxygenase YgiN
VREAERLTLAHDKGRERHEWYRSEEPHTYVLIERWTDRESAQAHRRSERITTLLKELGERVPEKFSIGRLIRLA